MKLKHIDSIRGIAILMVILVHTSQKIDGLNIISLIIAGYGQMGVQLFFVASAFTLCLSASKRENESKPIAKYAIRRAFRIAPTYYLGILGYFVLSLIRSMYLNGNIIIPEKYTFENVFSNLLFVHGFYEPANNIIVPGGWSIGTEMAFYVLFPLLYLIAIKIPIFTIAKMASWLLAGLFISQFGIALLSFNGSTISNSNFIYFNLITQLPVFFIGIGYYFISNRSILDHNWKFDALLFFCFTCISIFLWQLKIDHLFSIIPFTSGISFMFLMEIFRKNDGFNRAILIRIGQVSYSMYIIHFIFAHTITGFLAPLLSSHLKSDISLLLFYALSVSGSFILALLTEKYLEKPFIGIGRNIIARLNT